MKKEIKTLIAGFILAFFIVIPSCIKSQSSVDSYTNTYPMFNDDLLQIYQGARIAVPSQTLPNSLTSYTSTLPFYNTDNLQIYNSVRNIGDAITTLTNTYWANGGNTVNSNTASIGPINNRSMLFLTNNTQRLKLDSNGILIKGTPTYTDTNIWSFYQGNVNNYYQSILQNSNAGNTASTDFVVSNNLGTATTYYGNFGMNSSGFTGTGCFNLPSAVYVTAQNGDLSIGTISNSAIHIAANSSALDAITVSSSNSTTINGLAVNGTLTASGASTLNSLYVPTTATVNGAWLANSTGTISGALVAGSTLSVTSNATVAAVYTPSILPSGTTVTFVTVNGRLSQTGLGNSTFFGSGAGANDNLSANTNLNTYFGFNAGQLNITGTQNCAFGSGALKTSSATANCAIGYLSLTTHTAGNQNNTFGFQALKNDINSANNNAFGARALESYTGATGENCSFGTTNLFDLISGYDNVAIGQNTGRGITTGVGNTILGANVTGLAAGLTNNIILATGTSGAIKAQYDGTNWIMTGGHTITAACVVNGGINSGAPQTSVGGSTSGTANFSQPFQGTSYKKVIVYCSALLGTAAYTFPVAFTQTPMIMSSNSVGVAVVTSLSTSAMTLTGATTTGFLTIEGY